MSPPASMRRIVAAALVAVSVVAAAPARAQPVPLDGSWTVLDEFFPHPGFFSGPRTWASTTPVRFDVTDLFVVSDAYNVYDFGALVFSTPVMPHWNAIGATGPFESPPWTDDPDVAWASAVFSKGSHLFAPGAHSITIETIARPPNAAGAEFGDATVAFRATAIPEPSTYLLMASGIGLLGVAARYRRRL